MIHFGSSPLGPPRVSTDEIEAAAVDAFYISPLTQCTLNTIV